MFNRFSAGSVRPTGGAGGTSPRRSRARRTLTSIVSLTALSVAMLPATAFGLGNNRTVYRSCGANYVSSGYVSSGYSWAQTRKVSGSCAGRLSAGLQASNGYWTRVYGSTLSAYTSRYGYWTYGLHWGCDGCSQTYS